MLLWSNTGACVADANDDRIHIVLTPADRNVDGTTAGIFYGVVDQVHQYLLQRLPVGDDGKLIRRSVNRQPQGLFVGKKL